MSAMSIRTAVVYTCTRAVPSLEGLRSGLVSNDESLLFDTTDLTSGHVVYTKPDINVEFTGDGVAPEPATFGMMTGGGGSSALVLAATQIAGALPIPIRENRVGLTGPALFVMAELFTLIVLSAALASAVVQSAGDGANWNWAVAGIGLAGAFYFLRTRRSRSRGPDRLTVGAMALLAGIAVVQVVPLPTALVAVLSPARVELLRAAVPVLGPVPGWTTLSIAAWRSVQHVLNLMAYLLVFLIKEYPVFGCGLGGYEAAFLKYKTVGARGGPRDLTPFTTTTRDCWS